MAGKDGRYKLTVWTLGVGRIRREPWRLYVGDLWVDAEELRCHDLPRKLEPLIRALSPPPTAAETLWLAMTFTYGMTEEFRAGRDLLMEVVGGLAGLPDADDGGPK